MARKAGLPCSGSPAPHARNRQFAYSFRDDKWSGFFAGLFFLMNPFTVFSFGGEMLFQLALILWAFVSYRKNWTKLAALLVSFAILVRVDAALAGLILFADAAFKRKSIPFPETAIAAALIVPCLILSFAYYGSWLPSTIGAKIAQRDSGLWPTFVSGFLIWLNMLPPAQNRGLSSRPSLQVYLSSTVT